MIAEAMLHRQREPREILDALWDQATLWRKYGALLPADAALSAVRRLPGFSDWHPLDDWEKRLRSADQDALVAGLDSVVPEDELDTREDDPNFQERRRRALLLADWVTRHAGSHEVEDAVRAVERDICDHLEAAA